MLLKPFVIKTPLPILTPVYIGLFLYYGFAHPQNIFTRKRLKNYNLKRKLTKGGE